jgi:hypothetical protein
MKSLFSFFSLILPLFFFGISCKNEYSAPKYISIETKVDTLQIKNIVQEGNEDSVFLTSKTVNIGSFKKDTLIIFSCNLINKSNKSIKIEKIYGSCDCLTFNFTHLAILPNEESVIKINFHTGLAEGFFKKVIFVQLTNGKITHLVFYVSII